jgi:hypothetical protein
MSVSPFINEDNMKGGITYKPVEFEKLPVEVQDFGRITGRSRRIFGIYLLLIKGKPEDVNV